MKKYIKLIASMLTIIIIAGMIFVLVSPKARISANNKILSISLGNEITDVKASYVTPTTTKVKDNLFEFNFTGSKNRVRIGTGTSSFVGKMLLGAWDNECLIDLQMDSSITGNLGKATLTGTGETASIVVENNDWKLEYKPTKLVAGFNEYGGIDYLMTIKRKTSYNTINFTYNATNCVAYPQPPLTQEYTAGWNDEFQCEIAVTETHVTRVSDGQILVERPAHVVNSIVFYHATKGGTVTQTDADRGITTGKIGTLYSMKVTDSSATSKTTWTKWTLNGSVITLTIPLEFLQSAVFPITISPVGDTFGYGSNGHSSVVSSAVVMGDINDYSPASNGTATSMHVYFYSDYSARKVKCGLYSGTDYIDNSVTEITGVANTTDWYYASCSFSVFSATSYQVAFQTYDTNGYVYYDDTDVDRRYYTHTYANAWNDPATWTSSTTDRTFSIYCTYTPSASYDITETTTSKSMGILAISTTYWAIGHTPDNPIDDAHCTFTLTNNGDTCDLDMKMADFTGGVGWNIEETANPAADEVQINAYYSGQDPSGAGLLLKNADQEFYDAFAAAAHIHWDFKMLTGTSFTDGAAKTGVLTITARAET